MLWENIVKEFKERLKRARQGDGIEVESLWMNDRNIRLGKIN